jgi:hypothetical protein
MIYCLFLVLFGANLIFLPLYGWVTSEQTRVNRMIRTCLSDCTDATIHTWGIWATAEKQCNNVTLYYPAFPQWLNPHDLVKVRRWAEKCDIYAQHNELWAFVDFKKGEAFTRGYETDAWSDFIFFLALIDGITLFAAAYFCCAVPRETPEYFYVFPNPRTYERDRSFSV